MTQESRADERQPRAENRGTVFISYSRDDEPQALKLIADLCAAGHECCIDTSDIKGGDEWVKAVTEGIYNSYALVPLITENAYRSQWIMNEILWAQKKKLPIFPWAVEELRSADDFIMLLDYHWVRAFDGDYSAALAQLVSALPRTAVKDTENKSLSSRRQAELRYLDFLQLKNVGAERYTPVGGKSLRRAQRVEMTQSFELLSSASLVQGSQGLKMRSKKFVVSIAVCCLASRAAGRPPLCGNSRSFCLRPLSKISTFPYPCSSS